MSLLILTDASEPLNVSTPRRSKRRKTDVQAQSSPVLSECARDEPKSVDDPDAIVAAPLEECKS